MKIKITYHLWLMMAITGLLCLYDGVAQAQEKSAHVKVSIFYEDATLDEIFSGIGKKTGYTFSYGEFILNNKTPYTADFKEESLETILTSLGSKAEFSYVIEGKNVVIRKLGPPSKQDVGDTSFSVSGTVTDSKGELMPFVNILEKGTERGTISDIDGKYAIKVAGPEAVLVFSNLGYLPEEAAINSRSILDIQLQESEELLDEVVVVGYSVVKKENLTGAVNSIQSKDLENNLGTNTSQLLQGVAPNLNVSLGNGGINEEADINIRGIGSINGGQPLVLIDGVQGNLNRINPRDIESISVLKDAASASIYGARAAFGVILITTKSAKEGKLTVNYNANFGWSSPTIRTDNFITDGLDWARLSDKLSLLENSSTYLGYSESDYEYLEDRKRDPTLPSVLIKTVNGTERYVHYGNTDWWSELFNNAQSSQEHNINLAGGSSTVKFNLSGRYLTREGIYKVNKDVLDTYTLRAKIEANPTKWLSISNATNLFNQTYIQPATNSRNVNGSDNSEDWRKYGYHAPPLYLPRNPDGSFIIKGAYTNNRDIADGAFADLLNGKSSAEEMDFEVFNTTSLALNIKKGLTLKADYSFRKRNQRENVRIVSTPFTNQPNGQGVSYYKPNTELYKELSRNSLYQAFNTYADYAIMPWEDHKLNFIVGYNQEWDNFKRDIASRNGNISETLKSFSLATGENIFLSSNEEEWAIRAGFYRVKYSFDERYLIEFNGRVDLSSRFPSDNRLGFFPSASAAWRVSEEDFWEKITPYIGFFKLRGSYGSLGNQNIGAYDYLSTLSIRQSNYIRNNELINYFTTPQPVSSNFTWETSQSLDIGLDLETFKDRLTVSFDWFRRDVKDMLTQGKKLPSVFGANEPEENAADLRTKGFELSLGWRDQIGNDERGFGYKVNLVIGDSRTFITKFDNPTSDIRQFYVGQELGEIWGYSVEGFFKTDEEYLEHADQTLVNQRIQNNYLINHPVAGDIKFVDTDGDGKITPGEYTINNPGDLKIIGNSNPRYNYGINIGIEHYGFDLNVFAQGILKRDWNPGTDNGFFWGPFSRQYLNFYPKSIESLSWTPDNPDAYFPRLAVYADRGGPYEGGQLGVNSDKYLQNAGFLRLKNLTIGYTFPENILNKLSINRLRVYATGVNLFTFSPVYKNNPDRTIDPEQLGNGNDYPFTKTYAIGLNVTF